MNQNTRLELVGCSCWLLKGYGKILLEHVGDNLKTGILKRSGLQK
jgi:hypothetical protein